MTNDDWVALAREIYSDDDFEIDPIDPEEDVSPIVCPPGSPNTGAWVRIWAYVAPPDGE